MPPLLHRSAALGLCLTLWGCPSSPPPDAGAPRDAAPTADAPVRRNRRLRRRAARNRVRPSNGVAAAPANEPTTEVYDEDPAEAPRVRHNPESGPTLPEDLKAFLRAPRGALGPEAVEAALAQAEARALEEATRQAVAGLEAAKARLKEALSLGITEALRRIFLYSALFTLGALVFVLLLPDRELKGRPAPVE